MGLLLDGVRENLLDEVRRRLEDDPELVHQVDSNGNTALHLAAEKGLVQMAKLLIDFGADLNALNVSSKWSALHSAAYEGHAQVVGLLVAQGAIPDLKDDQGATPESWALEWEHFKCAMILGDATKRWHDQHQRRKLPAARLSESDDDDDDDDDDEEDELTHWVLPGPHRLPVDDGIISSTSSRSALIPRGEPACRRPHRPHHGDGPVETLEPTSRPTSDPCALGNSEGQEDPCGQVGILSLSSDPHAEPSQPKEPDCGPPSITAAVAEPAPVALMPDEASGSRLISPLIDEPQKDTSVLPKRSMSAKECQSVDGGAWWSTNETGSQGSASGTEERMISQPGESIVDRIKNSLSSGNDHTKPSHSEHKAEEETVRRKTLGTRIKDTRGPPSRLSADANRPGKESSSSTPHPDSLFDQHKPSADLDHIARAKQDLMRKLRILIDEEKNALEKALALKLDQLDQLKEKHRAEEAQLEMEIAALSENVDNLNMMCCVGNSLSSPNLEKELTCVSCSAICWPPALLYQCTEGDLLCQGCKDNPALKRCPQCNTTLDANVTRNKALERFAKKHLESL